MMIPSIEETLREVARKAGALDGRELVFTLRGIRAGDLAYAALVAADILAAQRAPEGAEV